MTDFNAQIKQVLQPSTQLFTANAKVLETTLAQQSSFVSNFIASSLDFNKQLAEQKDFSKVQQLSEQFGKTIAEQVTSSNKEIVAAITAASEKSTQVMKNLVEQTIQVMNQPTKK